MHADVVSYGKCGILGSWSDDGDWGSSWAPGQTASGAWADGQCLVEAWQELGISADGLWGWGIGRSKRRKEGRKG